MGALWVSWCVGFHVLGTPGEGGKGDLRGGGGSFFPALSCDGRACGGSCTVCVGPRPVRPVEDRGSGSEASLETAGGGTCLFFSPLLVSQITWEAGLGCCPPSPPHSSVTWRG